MTFDPQQIETLRTRLQGSVLLPGDEGYEKARQTWDAKTFDQHPALIVLPTQYRSFFLIYGDGESAIACKA